MGREKEIQEALNSRYIKDVVSDPTCAVFSVENCVVVASREPHSEHVDSDVGEHEDENNEKDRHKENLFKTLEQLDHHSLHMRNLKLEDVV